MCGNRQELQCCLWQLAEVFIQERESVDWEEVIKRVLRDDCLKAHSDGDDSSSFCGLSDSLSRRRSGGTLDL